MADINAEMLEREAASLAATGADVVALRTDVAELAQVTSLRDAAIARWVAWPC